MPQHCWCSCCWTAWGRLEVEERVAWWLDERWSGDGGAVAGAATAAAAEFLPALAGTATASGLEHPRARCCVLLRGGCSVSACGWVVPAWPCVMGVIPGTRGAGGGEMRAASEAALPSLPAPLLLSALQLGGSRLSALMDLLRSR